MLNFNANANVTLNLHFCQTSDLGLRLEVDFVFTLSQEEEQEQQEQEPHQNLSDRIELKVWNLEHRLREGVKRKIHYFCKVFCEGGGSTKFFFNHKTFSIKICFQLDIFLTKIIFQTKNQKNF